MQYYQEAIALGSKTGISLVSRASKAQIEVLYKTLWREIFIFERKFSRFLPGSELSIFNSNAGSKQNITPEFKKLLITAKKLAEDTDGLYNPFILPALQASGYLSSRVPGHEHDAVNDFSKRSYTTIERLEIGNDWAKIPYDTALDLGGCGKGYLADQLRSLLTKKITGYWLSFGGDIAVGGLDEQGRKWTIGIQSAVDQNKNRASLSIDSASGVATSGVTVHQGKKNGKEWHHLIDPKTSQPAITDVLLATVYADTSLMADVLASCAVILGSRKAMPFLKKHGAKAAFLQCRSASQQPSNIYFGNAIIMGNSNA